MTWDLAQSLETGDLIWDSKRDLAYADSLALIQQRIHRRLIIARGSFIYDEQGSLGSTLSTLLTMSVGAAVSGIESLVRQALQPMNDVNVNSVEVYIFNDGSGVVTDPSNVHVKIDYSLNMANVSPPLDIASDTLSTEIVIPA